MDIMSGLAGVNYVAVLVATLSSFVVGFFWYNPHVFGTLWMQGAGLTEEQAKQGDMMHLMGGSFVMNFVACIVLAMLFGGAGVMQGLQMGLLLGLGLAGTQGVVGGLYEQRPLSYLLINIGYTALIFALMGAIIGAW